MSASMSMVEQPVEQFLDRLASSDPTPGGGSAAAVMGAMGAALAAMVCNVTLGKKGLEGVEPEMRDIRAAADELRLRLTRMVGDDVAAFDALMAAYKLPKATDADKANRSAAIQASLRQATEVPLECARACAEVIGLTRRAGVHGYKGVVSDAGVGVAAAFAALRSAALNVYINAPALHDRAFAEAALSDIEALVAAGTADTDAIYAAVRARL
jgi:formiminotetrahydrofolate cyclodeaminase